MSIQCSMCCHPQRAEIEAAVTGGASGRKVAHVFGVGRSAVQRHMANHLGEPVIVGETHRVVTAPEDPNPVSPADPDLLAALVDARHRRETVERENRKLRAQLDELGADVEELRPIKDFIYGALEHRVEAPEWLAPARAESRHGTVNLLLSDLHLDEVVKPQSIGRVNAFNRRIGEQRVHRTFEKAIELPRDYFSGLTYDGIVVHLAGDTFSGDIHEELMRTNEVTPLESLLYWLDYLLAGLRLLADHYGRVHVVSVPGNHDRTTRKPIHKGRVETSLHYLFSKLLEKFLAGDERITFDIPLSPDAYTKVYETRILTTHGDQFRGGNGIGGILVPILRGDSRKRQRQSAVGQPYDLLAMGHFHQYINGPGVLINGSLKGYDEYAYNNNFSFETPQQALFIVTPEHGDAFHMPIQCMDKRVERWS